MATLARWLSRRGQSGVMRTRQDRWSGEPGRGRGVIIVATALVLVVRWLHGVRRGAPLLSAASSAVLIARERVEEAQTLWAGEGVVHLSLSLSLAHQQHPQHTQQQPSFRKKTPQPPVHVYTLQPGESNFTPAPWCSFIFLVLFALSAHLAGSFVAYIHR